MGLKTDINKLEERLLRRMGLEPTDVFGFKIEAEAHEFPKISVQFGAIYLSQHPELLRTLINGFKEYRLVDAAEYQKFAEFKKQQRKAEAERELGVPSLTSEPEDGVWPPTNLVPLATTIED